MVYYTRGLYIKLDNYCTLTFHILYAKYFISKNKMNGMDNIDFLRYLSYLKKILTIEESICHAMHQEKALNFLKPILDNL